MTRKLRGDCRSVVIIAPCDDPHAVAVLSRIRQLFDECVDCWIVDAATFPIASDIDFDLNGDRADMLFRVTDPLAGTIGENAPQILSRRDLSQRHLFYGKQISGVWWRRARQCVTHPDVHIDEFQSFCARTTASYLKAALTLLPTYNPIDVEETAARKPYQLMVAKRLGLKIPRTLITCDSTAASVFANEIEMAGGEVIYKHASSVAFISMPTRVLSCADRNRMDGMRYAPTILQERIRGGVNLRVAVVGSQVFVCEWRDQDGKHDGVDIRFEHDVRMWNARCSPALREQVLRIHQALGLTFGAYDFKRNSSGELFFLEVNPSGQWLDMELEGGHSISEVWATFLVEGITKMKCELPPLTMAELKAEEALQMSIPKVWTSVGMSDGNH